MLYDFAYILYAHGEKGDMQEKQPKRVTSRISRKEQNK